MQSGSAFGASQFFVGTLRNLGILHSPSQFLYRNPRSFFYGLPKVYSAATVESSKSRKHGFPAPKLSLSAFVLDSTEDAL